MLPDIYARRAIIRTDAALDATVNFSCDPTHTEDLMVAMAYFYVHGALNLQF